jgi:hypothetical protein
MKLGGNWAEPNPLEMHRKDRHHNSGLKIFKNDLGRWKTAQFWRIGRKFDFTFFRLGGIGRTCQSRFMQSYSAYMYSPLASGEETRSFGLGGLRKSCGGSRSSGRISCSRCCRTLRVYIYSHCGRSLCPHTCRRRTDGVVVNSKRRALAVHIVRNRWSASQRTTPHQRAATSQGGSGAA